MFPIVAKEQLSAEVYSMWIHAPLIAEERRAGQFIILQLDEQFGERIPLTIADADPAKGDVRIIFQAVGYSTKKLAQMEVGEALPVFLGPLGRPTHIEKRGTVVCVGGGIGVAPMHPIAQAMKAAGNKVIVIMGARNKDLLIMEEDMRKIADELIVCTDDGSYGRKALVTEPLKEVCAREKVRLAQLHHDRRHGHVRRLPRPRRRQDQVRLRRRPGVRRPPGGLRQPHEAQPHLRPP